MYDWEYTSLMLACADIKHLEVIMAKTAGDAVLCLPAHCYILLPATCTCYIRVSLFYLHAISTDNLYIVWLRQSFILLSERRSYHVGLISYYAIKLICIALVNNW